MQNYNNKELQTQTGYYDYGFRQLDPALGRWHVADAMAEKYMSTSPYAYVLNNPINHRDFMGLWSFPVYFDGIYGGEWSGTGDNWAGSSFNGNIPGGSNGEYARILGNATGGHFETITHTSRSFGLSGWGRNSAGHLTFGQKLKRFFNFNNWKYTVNTYAETVWVWDETGNNFDPDDFEDNGQAGGGTWDLNGDGIFQKNEADNWWLNGKGVGVRVDNSKIDWSGLKIPEGISTGNTFSINTTDAFLKLPYVTAATYGGTSFEVVGSLQVKVLDQLYHYNYRSNNSKENVMRNFMTWFGKPSGQGIDFMIYYYNPNIWIK